jgi:hypothetical protein
MNNSYFILTCLSLFILSCSRNDNPVAPPETDPAFHLQIVDQLSKPIADVSINYYLFSRTKQDSYFVASNRMTYFLIFKDSATFKIFVTPLGENVPTDTIYIEPPYAGHLDLYGFDTRKYVNGFYTLVFHTGDSSWTRKYLFQNGSTNAPLKSDNQGKADIDYDHIGARRTFNPPFLVDSVELSLYKQGYRYFAQSFTIDSLRSVAVTFTMSPQQ